MRKLRALHLIDAVRMLVVTSAPDPRMIQAAFAVFVGMDFAIRFIGDGEVELAGWPITGLILTAFTTLLAFVVPWRRLSPELVTVLPVLDIAALGAIRLSESGSAAGILVVVPALWLGRQLGRRGAVVVIVAVLVLTALPSMIVLGVDSLKVARAAMITVVAGWSALAVAFSLEGLRCERDEAERRGAKLATAVATIEQQQREAQAVFDAVDIGFVLLDRDGSYQGFNRRQAEFFELAYPDGQYDRSGQVGLVFGEDGVTPLTLEEMPTYRAANGEEFEDHRTWVGSDPQSRRALSVSARTLRGARGEFDGAVLAYKDVTELVRAMAVKEDFVALVSHELRTPLTSIAGYVEMLQEHPALPPGVRGQLEVVDRNTVRLLRLIGDLLLSAQVTSGHALPLNKRRCDLAQIAREAIEAVNPAADARGLTLETELPTDLWLVGDALRLGQLIDNLLANAVKYTSAGGRVTVALRVDGARAELAVTDTGVGIAAADRDRLFTPFFRAGGAGQLGAQGVGLGLTISKSIAESHGGCIEVDSEIGVGSTFRVQLPLGN
jgi:two-component system phosphate regulon sensor histidine kinase PhoR